MISKSHRDFWLVLSYIYLKYNKIDKALTLLQALYKLFPEDLEIMKLFSYANVKKGKFRDALRLIDKYLSMCGEKGKKSGYLIKSKALWHLDEKDKAREFMNKFIEL